MSDWHRTAKRTAAITNHKKYISLVERRREEKGGGGKEGRKEEAGVEQ